MPDRPGSARLASAAASDRRRAHEARPRVAPRAGGSGTRTRGSRPAASPAAEALRGRAAAAWQWTTFVAFVLRDTHQQLQLQQHATFHQHGAASSCRLERPRLGAGSRRPSCSFSWRPTEQHRHEGEFVRSPSADAAEIAADSSAALWPSARAAAPLAALHRRRARQFHGPYAARDGSPSAASVRQAAQPRAFAICGGMLLGLLWRRGAPALARRRRRPRHATRHAGAPCAAARCAASRRGGGCRPSLRLGPAAVNDTAGVFFRFALLSDTHYWQPTAARKVGADGGRARRARRLLVADSPTTSEAALRQLGASRPAAARSRCTSATRCAAAPTRAAARRGAPRSSAQCSAQFGAFGAQFSDGLFTTSPGTWRRCGTSSRRSARHSAHGPSTTCLATTTSTLRSAGSPRGAR